MLNERRKTIRFKCYTSRHTCSGHGCKSAHILSTVALALPFSGVYANSARWWWSLWSFLNADYLLWKVQTNFKSKSFCFPRNPKVPTCLSSKWSSTVIQILLELAKAGKKSSLSSTVAIAALVSLSAIVLVRWLWAGALFLSSSQWSVSGRKSTVACSTVKHLSTIRLNCGPMAYVS